MTIQLFVSFLVMGIAVTILADSCPEPRGNGPWHGFGSFHWEVLGVAGRNRTEQLDRLVEVVLQGFDCERRIQALRCRDGSTVNLTCQEMKLNILHNENGRSQSHNQIAVKVFIMGLDMETILCSFPEQAFNFPTDPQRACWHYDPPFSDFFSDRVLDYKLATKWRPERMRHLVWRGCPEDVAFVRRRWCSHLNNFVSMKALLCPPHMIDVISYLIQGHRVITNGRQPCDIQYVEEIFQEFGNASGQNYTMDRHGLSMIISNLSNPYPPEPVANRTHHTPHPQPPRGPMPPQGNPPGQGGNGPLTDPGPEYEGLVVPGNGVTFHTDIIPGHRELTTSQVTKQTTKLWSPTASQVTTGQTTKLWSPTTSQVTKEQTTKLWSPTTSQVTADQTTKLLSPTRPLPGNKNNFHKNQRKGFMGSSHWNGQQNGPLGVPNPIRGPPKNPIPRPPDVGKGDHPASEEISEDKISVKRSRRTSESDMLPLPPEAHRWPADNHFPRPVFSPPVDQTSDTPPQLWNADRLIKTMTGSSDSDFTIPDFYEMCPILVHHLLFVLNLPEQPTDTPLNTSDTQQPARAEVYGYSSLAVFIITLCSLAGVIFVKVAQGNTRHYVMAAMLALAAGNLCGDAVLHLVPEVIGEDGTDVDGDGHYTNEVMLLGNSDIEMSSVKMMLMLASIYVFFILEMLTSIYHTHDHDMEMIVIPESQIPKKKALRRVTGSTSHPMETSPNISVTSMALAIPSGDSISSLPTVPEEDEEPEPEVRVTMRKKPTDKELQAPLTLAWMVIVGDLIHNFADGLEIGATFSSSLADGLSTSLAVFCHELPHELGDFAVLISTGMSVKRAMVLNFVSGLTAFIGLYIGILTGQHQNVRTLIFAVGAGMFLYVALGNLVPELMKYFQRFRNWKMFFCQNFGFLAGYTVMAIIAIYEDEIKV